MNFSLFEDRVPIISLDESASRTLKRIGLIKSPRINRVHFCGVIVEGGNILIFAPRNSIKTLRQDELDPLAIGSLILQTFEKYHTLSNNTLTGSNNLEETDEQGLGFLANILWLLKDYTSYGLYATSVKSREINSGKSNWNRTLTKEIPAVGLGGLPVYTRLHSERIRYGEQSPISLIHAEVIKKLDKVFCWVITGDPNVRISPDLDTISTSPLFHDAKLYALRKELGAAYADREINLLSSLINYLESRYEGSDGEYLIGVQSFQNIWEEMLRQTLPGVFSVNSVLPKPAIFKKGSIEPSIVKGMVTDIVSRNDNVISVIDAKYYKAEDVEDSPGWPDLVKQLFYAKALEHIFPTCIITNWLAFPGKQKNIDDGPISKIGIIDPNTNMVLSHAFSPIGCSYFCPIDVMKRYALSKRYSFSDVSALFQKATINYQAPTEN